MPRASSTPVLPSIDMDTWREHAECRRQVTTGAYDQRQIYDIFFPTRTSPLEWIAIAKSMCRACPVRQQCLDEAISFNSYRWGILGGLTAEDRRRLVSKRRREYGKQRSASTTP